MVRALYIVETVRAPEGPATLLSTSSPHTTTYLHILHILGLGWGTWLGHNISWIEGMRSYETLGLSVRLCIIFQLQPIAFHNLSYFYSKMPSIITDGALVANRVYCLESSSPPTPPSWWCRHRLSTLAPEVERENQKINSVWFIKSHPIKNHFLFR